ncbi:MAG: sugar phosphate isomerase/epimerase family protein, partial [Rhodospirillales bacterium]|nr:sugar phosphate isomerase/epimerase family protein [Rhodospirillales bacterium]
RLGCHALVWAGGWTTEQARRAVVGVAGSGFDFIEIPLRRPDAIDVPATLRLLESHDLKAAGGLALGFDTNIADDDSETVRRGEALLNDAVAVARDLGAFQISGVLHSALGKYESPVSVAGRARAVEVLARVADRARHAGLVLALEAVNRYENALVNTAQQALELVSAIGADNVGVHLDTFHMNIEEDNPAAAIRACGPRLFHLHIGESHRGYLGTGSVDFDAIFGALAAIRYDGPIALESFSSAVVDPNLSNRLAVWRDLWTDSADLAGRARRFIAAGIERSAATRDGKG